MNDIRFPVFVRTKDSRDVDRFNSLASIQGHLEQIDVENSEYEAWDATGIPLEMSVQKSAPWLRLQPGETPQPEELVRAIVEFARLQGVQVDLSEFNGGDFAGVLERVTSAIRAKRPTPWWQRLKHHF